MQDVYGAGVIRCWYFAFFSAQYASGFCNVPPLFCVSSSIS